jgi:hypothetical protein
MDLGAGQENHLTAYCAAGALLTGGGFFVEDQGVTVMHSWPQGNGWTAYFHNGTTTLQPISALAQCLAPAP